MRREVIKKGTLARITKQRWDNSLARVVIGSDSSGVWVDIVAVPDHWDADVRAYWLAKKNLRFSRDEIQPLDPGIAALYGFDMKEG